MQTWIFAFRRSDLLSMLLLQLHEYMARKWLESESQRLTYALVSLKQHRVHLLNHLLFSFRCDRVLFVVKQYSHYLLPLA